MPPTPAVSPHLWQRLAAALLAIGLCSFVLFMLADTALHKQFWVDEGFEINQVCERPVVRMLLQGSYGCSPAPLFSAIERLVVRSVEPLGLGMRLTYRAPSLAAAALTLLVLLLGLQHRLGLPAALVAFATLTADEGFHHYAEQNRAYITWVLASAVLVIGAAELSVRDEVRPWVRTTLLLAAGLLAGLTALPGCLQALAAFAAWLLARAWMRCPGTFGRASIVALLAGGLAIAGLDAYYWSGSVCRGWQGAHGMGLDLLAGQERWPLFRRAATVLWPAATSVWVWPGYAALLVGALLPVLWWRRRAELCTTERFAFALALLSLSQVLVAIPIALSLMYSRYLFLPRMFLFILAARAALTAVGFWVLGRVLVQGARRLGRPAELLPWAASAAVTVAALWHADRISRPWHHPFPPVGEIDCRALKASELRLLIPQDAPDEFVLNFQVRLGRAFDQCAATPPSPSTPRYLLALDATNRADWFRVLEAAPAGSRPLTVCGEAITLREGRFRHD